MKGTLKFARLIVLVAWWCAGLGGVAEAQGGGGNGLDVRPFTLDFILNTVQPHIDAQQGEISRQKSNLSKPSGRGLTEKNIQKLARGGDPLESEFNPNAAAPEIIDRLGNSGDRWAFFHGAALSDLVVNHIHDIQTIVSRILSCLKFRLVNICIHYTPPFDVDVTLLIRYSFPTVKIETVDQPYKSGYFPRFVNDGFIIPLNEYLPVGLYAIAPTMTQIGVTRAKAAAQTLSGMYGHSVASDPNPSPDGGAGIGLGMSRLGAYNSNARWTTAMTSAPGYRHVEYHLMPEFFNTTVGAASPWCHHIRQPWWFSDWPFMMLPARFSGLSMILWPSLMVPMTFLPQVCTMKNVRTGKTPKDMAFPLAFPLPGGLSFPGEGGCQGTNAGAWLPVTNTAQSVHFTDASRVGTMKAIRVAEKLMSGSMYTYKPEKGDKFQWTRNDRMPKGCGGIEKWKLDENKLANSKKGKDPWNVVIMWTRFTCCMNWRGRVPNVWPPNRSDFRFH